MNKAKASLLSLELEVLLQQFADKNNLELKYKGSSYSTEAISKWTPKFELFDKSQIVEGTSFEKEAFIKSANRSFGLVDPKWYGTKVILSNGKKGTLTEYHPKKRKYPMIIKMDDGQMYKVGIDSFKANRIMV